MNCSCYSARHVVENLASKTLLDGLSLWRIDVDTQTALIVQCAMWIISANMKPISVYILVCLPSTTSFAPRQHTRQHFLSIRRGRSANDAVALSISPTKLLQGSEDNDDKQKSEDEHSEIFFNDFDFVIGGETPAISSSTRGANALDSALQERIRISQQEELKRETKLLQNWKRGDWSVRGFSLDPVDALSEASAETSLNVENNAQQTARPSPIQVSKVVADVNSQGTRIWVGRSNGDLVWVQLGQEYLAHFHSQISGTFTSDDSDPKRDVDDDAPSATAARFNSELVRESYQPFGQDNIPSALLSPFQILVQCSTLNQASAISNIVSVPDEDFVFTTCVGSGQIHQWHLSEDDIERKTPALSSPVPLSDEIHSHEIVALKLIYYQDSPLLFSVGTDGSIAMWDVFKGDLIYHCNISVEHIGEVEESDNNGDIGLVARMILCADVSDNHIFLGTATGYVLGYNVADLLNSADSGGACPLPSGKFKAHDKGVTAVACGGPGSLGRVSGSGAKGTSSTVLITGGACGLVKQWYVLMHGL
jgi:hypothetical protein